MPLIENPFHRVAVDLIGPMVPKSDKGNRYILTLVDYATRFPEAVALKSTDTEEVAEALADMFAGVVLYPLHIRSSVMKSRSRPY